MIALADQVYLTSTQSPAFWPSGTVPPPQLEDTGEPYRPNGPRTEVRLR